MGDQNTQQVHFTISGEWLTDFIREQYYGSADWSYEQCKDTLLRTLSLDAPDEEKEHLASAIIHGDKKFIGDNELSLVDDPDFDVYKYSKFIRPVFIPDQRGVRGILTVDGLFVKCEYQAHADTIEQIGPEKSKGSLAFWQGLIGSGVSKDDYSRHLSIHQIRWANKHLDCMSPHQQREWKRMELLDKLNNGESEVTKVESKMKISQLIKYLDDIYEQHGDLDVTVAGKPVTDFEDSVSVSDVDNYVDFQ